MSTLFIPWLCVPFPEEVNEYAHAAEEHTLEWALRFKLIKGNNQYQYFRSAKYGQTAERAYPKASFENLAIASDLVTFFYLLDDQCDTNVGKQPDSLRVAFSRFLDVMKQPSSITTDADPFLASLSDIWQRIHQRADSDLIERFVNNLDDFFESYIWEAENRARGIMPSLDTYIKMRSITSGFIWAMNLGEVVHEINLPDEVREYDLVLKLGDLANHVCSWQNDIVSVEKELRSGETHNLVLVLQQEYQLTLREAVNRAAEMWVADLQTFIALEEQLPSFGATVDKELSRYVGLMRSWMCAGEHWSYQSGRFRPAVSAKYLQPVAV